MSSSREADIDEEFHLRRRHPFARLLLLRNLVESALAQRWLECQLDIDYGTSEGQKLDVFPAASAPSPVFLFLHGGYFRALDKRHYRYIARTLVKLGYTVVLVNYDLAPRVSVAEIVRQVRSSFEWTKNNIHRWNGDAGNIVLCGHSVGAFLAARLMEGEWPGGSGIEKALLLSGLYDLAPMRRSYLNRDLRLTEEDVAALNPRADAMVERPNILVAVGANETDEFVRQSRDYSSRLTAANVTNELLILPRTNHYSMSRLLANRHNAVMDRVPPSPSL